MQGKTLEINRLSAEGEVLKSIMCRSGRVSAFRAQTEELLEVYMKAICGIADEEKFAVLLDGMPFHPSEHFFIGFHRKPLSMPKSVGQIFVDLGQKPNEVMELLGEFGLAEVANTPVSELEGATLHCVALLYATHRNDKVLVVKDPFLPVPEKYREKYAARLTQFAWGDQAIVVVVRLCWRPQSWVSNDLITRIQIDQTVRRPTIGIASDNQLKSLVSQIRKDFGSDSDGEAAPRVQTAKKPVVSGFGESKLVSTGIDLLKVDKSPAARGILYRALPALGISCLILSVMLVASYFMLEPQVAVVDNSSSNSSTESVSQSSSKSPEKSLKDASVKESEAVEDGYVLASYDSDVEKAVLKAYAGEVTIKKAPVRNTSSSSSYNRSSKSNYNNNKSPFQAYKPPPNYNRAPPPTRPNAQKPADAEKAREIFQRLLEMRKR